MKKKCRKCSKYSQPYYCEDCRYEYATGDDKNITDYIYYYHYDEEWHCMLPSDYSHIVDEILGKKDRKWFRSRGVSKDEYVYHLDILMTLTKDYLNYHNITGYRGMDLTDHPISGQIFDLIFLDRDREHKINQVIDGE